MRTVITCIFSLIVTVSAEAQEPEVGKELATPAVAQPQFEEQRSGVGPVQLALNLEPKESVPSDSADERTGTGPIDVFELSRFPTNERLASYKGLAVVSGRFNHRRLIFEEPTLERHGQSQLPARQLLTSSWQFFTRGAVLPYMMPSKRIWQLQPSIELP